MQDLDIFEIFDLFSEGFRVEFQKESRKLQKAHGRKDEQKGRKQTRKRKPISLTRCSNVGSRSLLLTVLSELVSQAHHCPSPKEEPSKGPPRHGTHRLATFGASGVALRCDPFAGGELAFSMHASSHQLLETSLETTRT